MVSHRATASEVLDKLKALSDSRARASMKRFGIHVEDAHGISAPVLRRLARQIGIQHELAQRLWDSGNHEARILAGLIDDPARVTAAQMERWARGFDSWDVVDGSCCHLFVFARPAWRKAVEWSGRKPEFVKRAGFALMAYLAWHDKQAADARFARLLPLIRRHASDERNFVKKAVNWALREIGKRNLHLNRLAVRTARQIRAMDSPAGRWVAGDALRELRSPAVQRRLRGRARR
ncbi:MAG TPA: DNA alkylation repair protein [Candidatus Acidoferrales bacterium]|nr:DNA alkylation repair protein [Candidatus Acidoferrales bacterium]